MPWSCLATDGWATTSMPPTKAVPDVGMTRVVSMPAVVVLPAPLGPSKPKISPGCTVKLRAATALKSVPAYCLVRSRVRITSSTSAGGASVEVAVWSSSPVLGIGFLRVVVLDAVQELVQRGQLLGVEQAAELGVGLVGHRGVPVGRLLAF